MNRSVLIALGILAALSLYMLTGLGGCRQPPGEAAGEAGGPSRILMTVQVRDMVGEQVPREVTLTGKTIPNRTVDLKTETAGRVVKVADRRGLLLEEGELIAAIELADRGQRLAQARASLEQAQLLYDAALRLQEQELRSAAQMAEALAQLRGAEQLVRFMELDIRNTQITAPFTGVLQERQVEVGTYLGVGDPVARLIDLDPIVVEGEVTEFQIGLIHPGERGTIQLADDRIVEGTIRYVAGEADPLSRTFRVELELPNPEGRIRAGITARIRVETEQVLAYRISPALIAIADDGRFGVKIVDEENRVQFVEADIVRSEPNALWLANLPPRIRLITIGQGFTQPGDEVIVAHEKEAWH